MRFIWNNIENKNWEASTKYKTVLWITGMISGLISLILWGFVQMWTLKTLDWMVCFIGYPVVISCYVMLLYCYRHEFHDGQPQAN